MRYLTNGAVFSESLEIGLATGTMPPAFIRPALTADVAVELEPSTVIACGPLNLLLASRTASWCLLTALETEVALGAAGVPLGTLRDRYPDLDERALNEFFVRLYQRGLLRVAGRPGLDPGLLDDGALYRDGYLIEILVTQQCNLGCRYCLAEAGPDQAHLHPELAYQAVDAAFNLPEDRPLSIQLSGGEPFVNFKLFKPLVEYIEEKQRQTGRRVELCTQSNGTLIDDEIAEFLRAHRISIGISCDGPSELSDQSRPLLGGQSSLPGTLRGMETLRRHGVRFGVILVLNRSNVEHPEELVNFFAGRGIHSLKANPISMIGDAQQTWEGMAITPDQYFDFLERFIDCVLDSGVAFSESNLGQYLQYLTRRRRDYRCMRSNCGAGRSFFLIDAGGQVYPCAHSAGIPSWRLGSLAEANGDLVGLGAKHSVVQRFPLRLVERIEDTRDCPWRHFCEGGCAVSAYQQFGTIQAPDPMCAFYERWYPRLIERLATDPARFQRLLDVSLGERQAFVQEFSLSPENGRERPWTNPVSRPLVHSSFRSAVEIPLTDLLKR